MIKRKSKSLNSSSNALYYALASFFLFGILLGIIAIIESQKALQASENEYEKKKAKKVMILSIIALSGSAIGLILSLPGHGLSFRGAVFNSWLVMIALAIFKLAM